MDNYKTYDTYKPSGVEWLGDVPAHWKALRGTYVFKIINERSKKGQEELLSVSEHHGVRPRSVSNVNMFMAESYEGYKLCYPGDLVINSLWAWSRGLGFSKYKGIVSTAYSVYRADHINYDVTYLNYLLRIENYVAQYLIASRGIWISRLLLSDWSFLRLPILTPPKEEQTRIANLLDEKTALIEKGIEIKQKQIELLKERRQILIHNAVTRGLNPHVKMKQSGVEWIGEIPEHWEVKRLKDICLLNIDSLAENTKADYEFKYVDISSVNLQNGIFQTEDYTFKNAPSRARRIAKEGNTIISTVRTYLKAIDFIDNEKSSYIYSTGFAVLQPKKSIYPQFLAYFVRSDAFTEQVTVNSKGMSYPAINSTDLSRLTIVHCGWEEQKEIVSYIETMSSKISTAISFKEKEIERLREYKATLINSVVTGKVKI